MNVEEVVPKELLSPLDDNARGFLKRVYDGGLRRYCDRLESIGFSKLGFVLDAGCGFGQWTLALAQLNHQASGIDISSERIDVATRIAVSQKGKVDFAVSSIDRTPYPDRYFDAIFCYGAIFFLDEESVISEFYRILKPGGKIYLCFNDIGWYFFLFFHRGIIKRDLFSFKMAINTFWNALRGTKRGSHIIRRKRMINVLHKAGFEILNLEKEGQIQLQQNSKRTHPFFVGEYLGFDAVLEVLAQKK